MPERDPTCIGRVRHILGATVTVALDPDLAGVAPIYRGQLQPVGQIGSLVRLPQGMVDLIGTVTLLGIAELSGPQTPVETVQVGERWLQVQLLGEIDRGTRRFSRGVGAYPGLDDPVHFATTAQLASVFPGPDKTHVRLGRLAAAQQVPVCLEASRLVVRHSAVVGSTGAGKTSAVASLLQQFARGGWGAANIVVFDPHGEYVSALQGSASLRSVLSLDPATQLRVPYWALPAQDILKIFAGNVTGPATARFAQLVSERRREFASQAAWLNIDASTITSDTPIPFDIREVWHQLDFENNETRDSKVDPASVRIVQQGNPLTLTPTHFAPYNPGGQAPHQGPTYLAYASVPERLRLGLRDPRLRFFLQPEVDPTGTHDPLLDAITEWLGGTEPVSVLDFSGVPPEATDVAIGVVTNLLFEVAVRSEFGQPGIGRPSPVLIVLEEAHRYLGSDASELTKRSVNRVAREGRKYGVGLMLVTQRPDELPTTALAQCGTIIALRLSNATDQGTIRAALPDTVAGLAGVLPSLRTGEAIVSGEAVVLPSRVLVDLPHPVPLAEDPPLAPWRYAPNVPDVARALARWRGTPEETET